jgi:hypothetical protein
MEYKAVVKERIIIYMTQGKQNVLRGIKRESEKESSKGAWRTDAPN